MLFNSVLSKLTATWEAILQRLESIQMMLINVYRQTRLPSPCGYWRGDDSVQRVRASANIREELLVSPTTQVYIYSYRHY